MPHLDNTDRSKGDAQQATNAADKNLALGSHDQPVQNVRDDEQNDTTAVRAKSSEHNLKLTAGKSTDECNNTNNSSENADKVSTQVLDVNSIFIEDKSDAVAKGTDIDAKLFAKKLFALDGYKKSEVAAHICKRDDYHEEVMKEYLSYFDFSGSTLDEALRDFLTRFSLSGETQERERVLLGFTRRYCQCNPSTFKSQDACHVLTCAIMLLNTDLHGQNIGRKMTSSQFAENLSQLNDGENFPKEVLKKLYQSIKSKQIEWAIDETKTAETKSVRSGSTETEFTVHTDISNSDVTKFYEGYLLKKSSVESDGKKTAKGKRGWKRYYFELRNLCLHFYRERPSAKTAAKSSTIPVHHALAAQVPEYRKQFVFSLYTADAAVKLFQASNTYEAENWVSALNFATASLSCPPLPGAVGNQRTFQRPILPVTVTRLNLDDQLLSHLNRVIELERDLKQHLKYKPEKKSDQVDFLKKDFYLTFEIERYKTYVKALQEQIPPVTETNL